MNKTKRQLKETGEAVAEQVAGRVIARTRHEAEACAKALRKGCAHALKAGLGLIWLHKLTAQDPEDNLRRGPDVSRETSGITFEEAIAEVGIPRPTAYRWMNAARNAALAAGLVGDPADLVPDLPEPEMPRWEQWELALEGVAEGMSLNRLLLGTYKARTEEHRYDELLTADEQGRTRARDLLEAVAEGKYTLAQAVKALGSQEAYDRLKAEGGEKVRRDPVYLDYDFVRKEPKGLVPAALKTLRRGFDGWAGYDETARTQTRGMWREVLKAAPAELLQDLEG